MSNAFHLHSTSALSILAELVDARDVQKRGYGQISLGVNRVSDLIVRRQVRTGTEISGARFHRAEHVRNVLHVRKTTLISALVLSWQLNPQPHGIRRARLQYFVTPMTR